jgi:hypothetical protein
MVGGVPIGGVRNLQWWTSVLAGYLLMMSRNTGQ